MFVLITREKLVSGLAALLLINPKMEIHKTYLGVVPR